MSYFYKCRSCQKTFPVFSDDIANCALCGSNQIEASPGAEPARLERGAYYEIDLRTGKPTSHPESSDKNS
jgi:hypothetical protein